MQGGEYITRQETRGLGAKSCWGAGVFNKMEGTLFSSDSQQRSGFLTSLDSLLAIEFSALIYHGDKRI